MNTFRYNQIIETIKENKLSIEIDEKSLRKYRVIPYKDDGEVLYFLSDKNDFNTRSNLQVILSKPVKIDLVDQDIFENIQKAYFEKASSLSIFDIDNSYDNDNLRLIRELNELIEDAILYNASDLHIEPSLDKIRVRIRINGHLKTYKYIGIEFHNIILTRIKILAGLDIAEKRLPQDGRFSFDYKSRLIDLRISTIPTIYGEKIAIRILDSKLIFSDINEIGFLANDLDTVKSYARKLNGFILVCGPTSSGKSTTIYSILKYINSEDKNIISLEDPVEYKIEGINQVQINLKTGLDFDIALKSVLRQDPDILSIGEIRTRSTLDTALRASITGHLVLSTLHTKDSISAIFRLMDMGAEDYLIKSSLDLVISQRLIRVLCDRCKEEYIDRSSYFKTPTKLYRPKSCPHCNQGYVGRIPIFEILEIDDHIRSLISKDGSYDQIYTYAKSKGFETLQDKFKQILLEGSTSIDEVIKI